MDNYGNFFVDLLSPFFEGLISIFKSIFSGIVEMLNIIKYGEIINKSKAKVNIIFILVAVVCLILLISLFCFLIYYIVKKIIKVIRKSYEQDSLLEEVEKLNYDMIKLKQENDKLTLMLNGDDSFDENGNPKTKIEKGESRFFKLTAIDKLWENKKLDKPFDDTLSLEDICERFRNYSANTLGLYYTPELIKLFISSFAASRLIILQGISGTGKTSLAYAFGSFLGNDSVIAPVQPSWRDRTELFGYFNESNNH